MSLDIAKQNDDTVIIASDFVNQSDIQNVSDGYHTFGELYSHRIKLFLSLMNLAHLRAWDCGWSKRHDDGELCFGGGWCIGWIIAPSGLQIRYHFEDWRNAQKHLECEIGLPWNGVDETLDALDELMSIMC
jgi:hypothetical protein